LDQQANAGGTTTIESTLGMSEIGCGLSWQHDMAVTQERENMRVASRLKQDGWVHDMYDLSALECHKRAEWCMETFGPMYNDTIMAGKWYGAELPFQTGMPLPKKQYVFMFRDDKLYTMYRMMYPE